LIATAPAAIAAVSIGFADGSTGRSMHNRYLVLYMRATREAITAYERAHPGRTLWFSNRAGFSGLPGSAAYERANFPGDEATDFGQAAGLASSTPDMLNRAIGGAHPATVARRGPDRRAAHAPAVAAVPRRREGGRRNAAMDARTRRLGRTCGDEGRDVSFGVFPARLLARAR
jgi:hypothetical protein